MRTMARTIGISHRLKSDGRQTLSLQSGAQTSLREGVGRDSGARGPFERLTFESDGTHSLRV